MSESNNDPPQQVAAHHSIAEAACTRTAIAGPGICMTQQQIAEATGVSRAMIHLVEKRAIKKIKAALLASGFDPASEF